MSKSDIANTPRKVFISYSHKDEGWKNKLLPHLKALEQAGVNMVVWEDRQIDAGAQWAAEIEQAMADAGAAVLLISADYLASGFCIKEEVPYLLKRQEQEGMLLIPILIRKCPWKAHRWLADRQMLPRDGKCVAIDFPADLADAVFADVAERVFDHFTSLAAQSKAKAALPIVTHEVVVAGARMAATVVESARISRWPALPADRIDLTRLPETGAALFGRDEELKLLDQAWSSGEKPGEAQTRVLAFVAYGGVGKSTLVNHWLQEMQRDHFRGATCVFGWSFYSQGAREEGMASADTFTDAALRFFGDADPASGSAWDKGERLARLAGAERALLVLDGMEPLQSGHVFEKGKLRDPALEVLLRGLARGSGGLCLITTREPVVDLAGRPGFAARDLEQISPEAGRALLRTARVVGADAELEALAGRFGPHALAVSLLGVYLHEKDPNHGIGPAKTLEQMPGKGPIDRVLAGFEQWLAGAAELEVVRMLGLFDRPADAGCLGALRAKPPIPSLTDRVVRLRKADWDGVLGRLERLRLIHVRHKDSGRPVVDAHPLIREHFARQLREKNPDAWRIAHSRLYEYFLSLQKKTYPDTGEEMEPLFQAVTHGVKAGCYEEAFDVYMGRIQGESRAEHKGETRFDKRRFASFELGLTGEVLAALASFFEGDWQVIGQITDGNLKVEVLSETAFALQAVGRPGEAIPLFLAAEGIAEKEEEPDFAKAACVVAAAAGEIQVFIGEVTKALVTLKKAVELADKTDKPFEQMHTCAKYAMALHQAGKIHEALAEFEKAKEIGTQVTGEYGFFAGVRGYYYCDLLLDQSLGQTDAMSEQLDMIRDKSKAMLDDAAERGLLVPQSLYNVILAKVAERGGNLKAALVNCDDAVQLLLRSQHEMWKPLGFLTRAWLRFLAGVRTGPESSQADLDEAWEIAERGPMRLYMADIHLYRARLFGSLKCGVRSAKYPWESPQADLAAARKLIEQCGYWRRKEELEDAEEAAKNWEER